MSRLPAQQMPPRLRRAKRLDRLELQEREGAPSPACNGRAVGKFLGWGVWRACVQLALSRAHVATSLVSCHYLGPVLRTELAV